MPRPGHGTDLMWTPAGPRVVGTSPLRVTCPACHAAIAEPCTTLVPRRGRVRRSRPHDDRYTEAERVAALTPSA